MIKLERATIAPIIALAAFVDIAFRNWNRLNCCLFRFSGSEFNASHLLGYYGYYLRSGSLVLHIPEIIEPDIMQMYIFQCVRMGR